MTNNSKVLLVADDESDFCKNCEEYFGMRGYKVISAASGSEAIQIWRDNLPRPDVGIIDWNFPDPPDGAMVVKQILRVDPWATLIMVTAYERLDIAVDILKAGGLDYLVKPVTMTLLESKMEAEMSLARERQDQIRKHEEVATRAALFTTCVTLSNALESKSPYTQGHSHRVSEYARLIAQRMGLDDKEVVAVDRIGLLHDIGKIGIPDSILNAERKLSDYEWER